MELGFQQLAGDRAIGRTILKEGSRTIEGASFKYPVYCGLQQMVQDKLNGGVGCFHC